MLLDVIRQVTSPAVNRVKHRFVIPVYTSSKRYASFTVICETCRTAGRQAYQPVFCTLKQQLLHLQLLRCTTACLYICRAEQ